MTCQPDKQPRRSSRSEPPGPLTGNLAASRPGRPRLADRPEHSTLDGRWESLDSEARGKVALLGLLPSMAIDTWRTLLDEDPEDLFARLDLNPGLLLVANDRLRVAPALTEFVKRRVRGRVVGMPTDAPTGADVSNQTRRPGPDPRSVGRARADRLLEDVGHSLLGAGLAGEAEHVLGALADPDPDPDRSTALLFFSGERARCEGDLDRAVSYLQEAYWRASSAGAEPILHRVAASLAAAHAARGPADCLPALAEWAATRLNPKAHFGLALCHGAIGSHGLARGEWRVAGTEFRRAFAFSLDAADPEGMVREVTNLAECQFRQGEFAKAVPLYGAAARLAEDIGVPVPPMAYGGLSLCCGHLGRFEGAWRWAETGMALAWRSPDRRALSSLFHAYASLHLLAGDPEAAGIYFDAALIRALAAGERNRQADAWLGLGRIALSAGDLEQSLMLSQQALASSGVDLFDPAASAACSLRAEIALAGGRLDDAERLLAHLAAIHESSPSRLLAEQVDRLRLGLTGARAGESKRPESERADGGWRKSPGPIPTHTGNPSGRPGRVNVVIKP